MSQFRLARLGLLMAALGLNMAPSLFGATSSAYAADAAAEVKKEDTVRAEMGKPLRAVPELIAAKQYKEAFAKINEADALPAKTAYEIYSIERARAVVANASGDRALASKSLEMVINSGKLPANEQQIFIRALAGNFYQDKDYANTVVWLTRYQKEGGNDPQVRSLLIQSMYLNNDFASAARESQLDLDLLEKAGKAPEENQLNLMRNCSVKLKDRATYKVMIEKLAAFYPKPDHWTELLDILEASPGYSDHALLDTFRFRLMAGTPMPEKEMKDMAELAIIAALPVEAKRVIDAAYQAGTFGTGPNANAHKLLRDRANKAAADDMRTIAQGEATAAKSKDGNGQVNVGFAYISHQQFDKGISLMEQGIRTGGLKHPEDAKLHLAYAYMLAGRKADAITTFKTVQSKDGLSELARYWTLYLNAPTATAPAAAVAAPAAAK
jgi:hypothetical protein